MADCPGQTVDHRLLIFVDMAVGVGDAVGVHIFVVVFVAVHSRPSLQNFLYHTLFFRNFQAPEGDIR